MSRDMDKKKTIIHKKLDGELNKHETARFKSQIKTDPAVKMEYERLKRITETSQKVVKPVPPPPDFTKRVLDNLDPRP